MQLTTNEMEIDQMNLLLKSRRSLDQVLRKRETILRAVVNEKREPSASESKILAETEKEKRHWQKTIDEIEAHRANPHKHPDPGAVEEDPRFVGTSTMSSVANNKTRSFRSLFGEPKYDHGGFRNLAEMSRSILSGRHDDRLYRDAHGAAKLPGEAGGFLVSEELVVELFDELLSSSIVLSRAQVLPVPDGVESRLLVVFDSSDRSSSVFGFSGQWTSEAGTTTVERPKLRTIRLTPRKLQILSAITSELIEDMIVGGGSAIEQALLAALRFHVDKSLLATGNGAAAPLALIKQPSRITVSKGDTGSGSISYQNLIDMESRVLPEISSRSVWICSPSCKPSLLQLSVTLIEDVAAAFIPALTQENGVWKLLGRELLWSEHLPACGTEGDIVLCDLGMVGVALRRDFRLDRSDSVYFQSDEIGLRATVRLDAAGRLPSAITPSGGGPSLSWCITLQGR